MVSSLHDLFVGCPTGAGAFDKIPNQHIAGGTEDTSADTLEKCFESCLNESVTVCAGVDFRSGKCWIHTETANNGPLADGHDHYNRKLCGKHAYKNNLFISTA